MTHPQPIFTRPAHAKQVFGISRSTLYRWADKGLVTLHKRGNMSFVRNADVEKVIVSMGDQLGDSGGE